MPSIELLKNDATKTIAGVLKFSAVGHKLHTNERINRREFGTETFAIM